MSTLDYCLRKASEIPYQRGYQRVYSCVVDRKGNVLGEGPNFYGRSHPKQKEYSLKAGLDPWRCYLHSEVYSLLQAAKRNPKHCKLIVARVGSNGRALDAKPCASCSIAIREAGFIKEISYSVEQID